MCSSSDDVAVPPKFYDVCRLCLSPPPPPPTSGDGDAAPPVRWRSMFDVGKRRKLREHMNSSSQQQREERTEAANAAAAAAVAAPAPAEEELRLVDDDDHVDDDHDDDELQDAAGVPIAKKIMTCLSIVVSEGDQLPHLVCTACCEKLDAFYVFKEMANRMDNELLRFVTQTRLSTGTHQEKLEQSTVLLEELLTRRNGGETAASLVDEESMVSEPSIQITVEPEIRPDPDFYDEENDSLPMHLVEAADSDDRPSSPNVQRNQQRSPSPHGPADLSKSRPENVTCVPELPDFIKEEDDGESEYSNSSDPERLEVDMSQGGEDHSNSTTATAPSPSPSPMIDAHHLQHHHHQPPPPYHPFMNPAAADVDPLWRALQNGRTPGQLTGEASHLLRKLITCKKLGMTITPAPPFKSSNAENCGGGGMGGGGAASKKESTASSKSSSGRRKQTYPTRMDPDDSFPCENDADEFAGDYGTNSWCNMQLVKNKGGAGMARKVDLACTNCGTQTTTIWRRNVKNEMVCNACGLYYKLHGIDRPHTMRRDTIHTRRRRPKDQAGEKRSSKKAVNNNANNNTGDIPDSEDVLRVLRKQLQPHLVMALTGQKLPADVSQMHQAMMADYQKALVMNQSPSQSTQEGDADADGDGESEEENYNDLPLNLVATQMETTESH